MKSQGEAEMCAAYGKKPVSRGLCMFLHYDIAEEAACGEQFVVQGEEGQRLNTW